jgi:hypothetical protein
VYRLTMLLLARESPKERTDTVVAILKQDNRNFLCQRVDSWLNLHYKFSTATSTGTFKRHQYFTNCHTLAHYKTDHEINSYNEIIRQILIFLFSI